MTSKERVRKAIQHQQTDRIPTNMECVGNVWNKIMAEKKIVHG